MTEIMAEGTDKVLSKNDKSTSMSDTVFAKETIQEAFPKLRYGSVIAAQCEAYTFLRKRVTKNITMRRVRSLWEGAAKRIDGEEKDALREAKIEEARNEYKTLRSRLEQIEGFLAVAGQEAGGAPLDSGRQPSSGLGGSNRT